MMTKSTNKQKGLLLSLQTNKKKKVKERDLCSLMFCTGSVSGSRATMPSPGLPVFSQIGLSSNPSSERNL